MPSYRTDTEVLAHWSSSRLKPPEPILCGHSNAEHDKVSKTGIEGLTKISPTLASPLCCSESVEVLKA